MKHKISLTLIALALTGSMALSSCSLVKPSETTEETTAASTTEATMTESASESTTESETEATTTTSETTTSETRVIEPITPPEKGCAIEFPDREVYDYKMDLKFDPKDQTIGGHVVFDFYNDSKDTWNELCLRDYPSLFDSVKVYATGLKKGGGLTVISNIKDSRSGSLSHKRDGSDVSVVWIDLDKPLAPSEHMTLEYDFVTMIPNNPDRFGVYGGIYNVCNFYPILAEYVDGGWSHLPYISEGECFYSEISNYHVTIEAPKAYTFASTGSEVSSDQSGDNLIHKFEAPFVRDFVFSTCEFYEKKTNKLEGVDVNVFYSSDKPAQLEMNGVVDVCFKTAETSLKAFGDAFGKYPYADLDIVLSELAAGGMEYPNLVIITNDVCHDYVRMFRSYDQLEVCLAHEIGHQWFMGIVGSNSAAEPWLDESITSYTELVYYEYVGGKQFENQVMGYTSKDWDMSALDRDKDENSGYYVDSPYSEFATDMDYVSMIYGTGKGFCYQMEEAVGRDEFHGALRAYVHKYAFTNANTKDFLAVLYGVVGRDNDKLNKIINNMLRTKI